MIINLQILNYCKIGYIKTISGPSTAARTGKGSGGCGHMVDSILLFNVKDPCTNLIGGGGRSKNHTKKLPIILLKIRGHVQINRRGGPKIVLYDGPVPLITSSRVNSVNLEFRNFNSLAGGGLLFLQRKPRFKRRMPRLFFHFLSFRASVV